jgi:hypothetical protein
MAVPLRQTWKPGKINQTRPASPKTFKADIGVSDYQDAGYQVSGYQVSAQSRRAPDTHYLIP